MADKKTEKEKLMEKVFGKDAPDRRLTDEDLEMLRTNLLDLDTLSPEWKAISSNSRKLQEQTQEILNNFTDADLEQLKNEIRKDFGDQLPLEAQEDLTIVRQQIPLNAKFEDIEAKLNEEVLCQKDYNHALTVAFRRPTIMGVQPSGAKNAILIIGQTATGRHSSINIAAKYLKQHELINNDDLSFIDLAQYSGKEFEANLVQDLYTATNKSQIIVFDNLDQISANFLPSVNEIVTEGQLTLSKRYTLNNKQLVETTNSLVKDTVKTISFKGKYLVFLTTLKVEKLLEVVGAKFINTMGDVIKTKDIVKEDLEVIYPVKLKAFQKKCLDQLNIDVKVSTSVRDYLNDNFIDRENVNYLNNFFDRCYSALAEYKLKNLTDEKITMKISAADNQIVFSINSDNKTTMDELLPDVLQNAKEEAMKELNQLVGLEKIKKYVLSLEDFYEAQKIREKQGLKTSEVSKHMIFTGNPGTGKTTIARVIAKYLKAIGVLSNGQLIEVSRNDLVGKYMGHTAPQTMQVIQSAMGGILFIDEAYSLYRGTNDSFGLEAIDTLVKAMEDNRDDLIVILAGYTKEMKDFLESNSGLASRFPNQIEFPDYTAEELYAITEIQAKSKGYRLHELIREPLTEYFRQIQENDSVRSGNGRLARNVVEEAIIHQSKRILSDKNAELDLIILEDIDFKIKSNNI